MGERRKRKSMWDMQEETKQFSETSEHNSSHDRGRYHEFSSSGTYTAPNSRDHYRHPSHESNEEKAYKNSFENDRSDSRRHPRRDRSPIRDYRNQSHARIDQTSLPDKSFRFCRDFSSGRCRNGSQCRLLHSKNTGLGNISRDSYIKSDLRDDDVSGSHHFESNAKNNGNGSSGGTENENINRRISEYGDICTAEKSIDKSENHILQNQDGNSNFQGQSTSEDHRVVENNIATSIGFDGSVNLPEIQLGALLDLHTWLQSDQNDVQMAGMLETKVTSVTTHAQFPTPIPDDLNLPKNTDACVSGFNIPRDNPTDAQLNSVTNEHGHYIDQADRMQAKKPSPEADTFRNSKSKQDALIANSKIDEGNKIESLDGGKKVEESIGSKDEKAIRVFKNSLIEFVKDILKPTWKEGRLSKEVHKTIVKKVVDKINGTIQADHVPKTQEKVDQYLSFSKLKIAKLVQAYVERFLKTDS